MSIEEDTAISTPLITTTVGSYPAKGLEPQEAIRRAVEDQRTAGIALLTDGQVRADMIGIFARCIPGYHPEGPGYRITGKIQPATEPITVADILYARSLAGDAEVKGILTGPTTMALASKVEEGTPYSSAQDPALVLDLAEALAAEARALVAAGVRVIQIDEPFFSLGADLETGSRALKRITVEVPLSMVHVCGDVRAIFAPLLDLPVQVLDIEGANLRDLPWVNGSLLQEKGKIISYGCISTNSDEVEEGETIRERIREAISQVGRENLWISPDCGMRLRSRESALAKLCRMVEAARALWD
ncbi:MAG: methionine synthase [Candidatus Tectomicrobia bacterium]|uniref:Methionine synthase n=1 Tax=Tectimicrobiota bacterium TaxID=2528274 RepID=A0A932CMF3_UNCTE|nr:methionine synthase [Candidatus Tectomicrobia bacterium]